jgi:death-on-curing family protein
MSYAKLEECIREHKTGSGDVYDKGAVLLRALMQAHAFVSGNKRTSFASTREFLTLNEANFSINDENGARNARILIGIREGFYSNEDICTWIRTGEIHDFQRQ